MEMLLSKLKLISFIVLITLCIGALGYYHLTLAEVEKQRDQALAEKQTLATQLAMQNAAIASLQTQGKAREAQLRQAEQTAKEQHNKSLQEVNQLLNTQLPDGCLAAIKWGAVTGSAISRHWYQAE